MNDWIQDNWPNGGLIALGWILIRWLLGREVKRAEERIRDIEARQEEHDKRMRQIETNFVCHEDIDELRHSMMASVVGATDRIEKVLRDMHQENREVNGRIHERVDALWERRAKLRE